jgi:1-acyl-sn-glycerol-3-phosphate acyltransferase
MTAPWPVRRLVVAPLMPVLALLALALFPIVLVGHALVAVVLVGARRRRARWRLPRAWLFGVAYLLGETACLLACLALWLRFLGRLDGDASRRRHLAVLRGFLGLLIALAGFTFRFRLEVHEPVSRPQDPARMSGERPVLVLARHAGPGASFVLVHLLMHRYRRSPRIVLTERLRWDPSIDVLLSRLGCRFIQPGGDHARAAIGELAAALGRHDALVLFPEGGDWTPTRQRRAVARLRRKGLTVQAGRAEQMVHVLPPRPAGTAAALAAAPAADVVVFSHTGHDELLDLPSVWAALPLRRELDVVWWREASAPRSADEDVVGEWLYDLWRRIDAWVGEQHDLAAVAPASE